jgi:hypothetical protein
MLKFIFLRVRRVAACVEARLGRRFSDCVFASKVWGVWVNVKMCFLFWCVVGIACVVGGSFRASRLGLRRCFQGLGVCGWMLKFIFS